MHTWTWDHPEHKNDEAFEVAMHHNSDFSGEAIISIPTSMCTIDLNETAERLFPGRGQQRYEIRLPAEFLKMIGRGATINEIISHLEDM
jgi:hypothetical protein